MKTTLLSIYFLLVIIGSWFTFGYCWDAVDCLTYSGNTGESYKLTWTPGNIGEEYSTCLRFWHVEWDELSFKTETQEDHIQVYFTRSGHYVVQAKTRERYTEAERTQKATELVTREDILDHMIKANCDDVDLGANPATFTDVELRDAVLAFGEASSMVTSQTAGVYVAKVNKLRIQEWDCQDGFHGDETIGYIAIDKGVHALPDGTMIEAGQFESVPDTIMAVSFEQAMNVVPVVIASVTSYNEVDAVTVRLRNITVTGFEAQLREQDSSSQEHNSPQRSSEHPDVALILS